MRPADCRDSLDVQQLREAGLAFNDTKISVLPPNVHIQAGPGLLFFSQTHFRRFAEWYLEDQDE